MAEEVPRARGHAWSLFYDTGLQAHLYFSSSQTSHLLSVSHCCLNKCILKIKEVIKFFLLEEEMKLSHLKRVLFLLSWTVFQADFCFFPSC